MEYRYRVQREVSQTLGGIFVTLSAAQAATAVSNLHFERRSTIRSAYAVAGRAIGQVIWISFAAGIATGFLLAMVL